MKGMVRRDDHRTSYRAAAGVKRYTLREQVVDYALSAGVKGFIDDALKTVWFDRPESSLRKRRTELAQENILLDTGFTRLNRQGQYETVWVHRSFHPCPPPIVERQQPIGLKDENARLKAILDAHGIAY